MVNKLVETVGEEQFKENYSSKIVYIIEKYLGKGKKINQCTRDQVEMIQMINSEIKDLIK